MDGSRLNGWMGYLDETEDFLEFEALIRLFPGRLDEGIDEERVLGDALRHKQDALGDALLLAQRIHGALPDECGQLAVLLHHLLVHGHRFLVPTAKVTVQRPAPHQTQQQKNPFSIFPSLFLSRESPARVHWLAVRRGCDRIESAAYCNHQSVNASELNPSSRSSFLPNSSGFVVVFSEEFYHFSIFNFQFSIFNL